MVHQSQYRSLAIFLGGALFGALIYGMLNGDGSNGRMAYAAEGSNENALSLTRLQQEVEILKAKTPSQAHAMMDVDYHYTNLWFAAQAENWPLAEFYWKETMSHMRWAVRIIPVRKMARGRTLSFKIFSNPSNNRRSRKSVRRLRTRTARSLKLPTATRWRDVTLATKRATSRTFVLKCRNVRPRKLSTLTPLPLGQNRRAGFADMCHFAP